MSVLDFLDWICSMHLCYWIWSSAKLQRMLLLLCFYKEHMLGWEFEGI